MIASDGNGDAYVGGSTHLEFPPREPASLSSVDNPETPRAFVLKLGPNGALLYSTFVGGSNGDMIRAITADPAGNIYLTGQTNSPDFPIKNGSNRCRQPPSRHLSPR